MVEVEVLTRQELYELVWSAPMRQLSKRYGVSDVAFAKRCRQHGIPLPERGYWAKVRADTKPARRPLPERGLGMPEHIPITGARGWGSYYLSSSHDLIEADLPSPPVFNESLKQLIARVDKQMGRVAKPTSLRNPHPAISQLLEKDEERREKQRGRWSSSWDAPFFDSPLERRRLTIANTIFLSAAKLGMRSSITGTDAAAFSIEVGEQRVTFSIDPPGKKRDPYSSFPQPQKPLPKSTRLELKSASIEPVDGLTLTWCDEREVRIEVSIREIVVNLITSGELLYRQQRRKAHQFLIDEQIRLRHEAEQARIEEERQIRERREKREQARVDRLLAEAESLRQAEAIRAYVQKVTVINASTADSVPRAELERWAQWALTQADRIDPVASGRFLEPGPEDIS